MTAFSLLGALPVATVWRAAGMQLAQTIEITNPSRRRLSKAARAQYKGITGRWPVHGSRVPTRDQPREACRGRRIVAARAPQLQGRRPPSAYHGSEGARLVARLDVSTRRRPQRGRRLLYLDVRV